MGRSTSGCEMISCILFLFFDDITCVCLHILFSFLESIYLVGIGVRRGLDFGSEQYARDGW